MRHSSQGRYDFSSLLRFLLFFFLPFVILCVFGLSRGCGILFVCCVVELSGLLIATMCFIGDEMVFGFGRLVKVLIKEMY